MTWTAYCQTRDGVLDLGAAGTPEEAIALARRLAPAGAGPLCLGCRREDVPPPDVEIGAQLGRAVCGIQPAEISARRRIVSALWRAEIATSRGMRREEAARRKAATP